MPLYVPYPAQGALIAGEAFVGRVGGVVARPSASFTRPATVVTYDVGKLVANHATAGSVVPLSWVVGRVAGGSGVIPRVRLEKTTNVVISAVFRLHLYYSSPTVVNGDGGVYLTNRAGHFGAFEISVDKAYSDGASGVGLPEQDLPEIFFKLTSGQTIWGLLEARSAYQSGVSEQFTAELDVLQD